MVGLPPPDGPRRRSSSSTRTTRSASSSRSARSASEKKGKQIWRYRVPGPGLTTWAAASVYDPGQEAGATRTTRPFTWQVGDDGRGRRRRPAPSTSGASSPTPHPARDRPARLGPDRPTTRRALIELGEWVADHGIDGERARPGGAATCCSGCPPRVGQWLGRAAPPRRARPDLDGGTTAGPQPRPHDARRSRARRARARPTPARG